MKKDEELDFEDTDEDDEPMWWDVVEERYGRPLTEGEWRVEIKASYDEEFTEITEEEMLEDLQRQKDWQILKVEIATRKAQREEQWAAIDRQEAEDNERAKAVVNDLYAELCSPPIGEDEEDLSDEGLAVWKSRVNEIIRTRLEFNSLLLLMEKGGEIERSSQARRNALKSHTENHALRDMVYAWADTNVKGRMTLDAAASLMSEKVVPLKWRTVRSHLTEWKKLRSASTP